MPARNRAMPVLLDGLIGAVTQHLFTASTHRNPIRSFARGKRGRRLSLRSDRAAQVRVVGNGLVQCFGVPA